ncbi:DUF2062 domain-containing protein [Polymorphum gilvum]|uniref:DUF2062 domain-containing protein n=1 Tax=Polymorphum gilvum (strain LMG 25793 / CGMCC 1.9160 / SL003B-26A1) TaxID=991905 RepID=F2IW41_POLGS|nr:DUF2062 domain-containing protein [Polymorphum gilvum]ADZ70323.1 hypothetical protein SL003B_1897 [Polymorphum gilvum SL003B-26A1]
MLFQRRNRPSRIERLRIAVWPRNSWMRSFRYYAKRVLRLSASPNAIALGFAAGAFASFTPFMGFHFLIAAAIAYVIRGNLLASALGTAVGNPLTFPFIWATTYKIGNIILGADRPAATPHGFSGDFHDHLFSKSFDALWPLIKPMLIGAVPLGSVVAIIFYVLVYQGVRAYQDRRRRRMSDIRNGAATLPTPGGEP